MSKSHFPESEFKRRRGKLATALGSLGLDWLVAIHPATILWLTGSSAKSYQSLQCVLFDVRNQSVVFLVREAEQAEVEAEAHFDDMVAWGPLCGRNAETALETLRDKAGPARSRLGMEIPDYYLAGASGRMLDAVFGAFDPVDVTRNVHDVMLVKSQAEIELIRQAAGIADASMSAFANHLEPGKTELALCGIIYETAMRNGGDQFASPINFPSGPRGGFSHARPTERMISTPDFGSVEYATPYRNYPVSIGRQFAVGTPTSRQADFYQASRAAADACIARLVPGAPATEAYAAARSELERAGYGRLQVHTLGYNLISAFPPATGGRMHLSAASDYVIEEGMQLSVCPPVFSADEHMGARLVDNVLVGSAGAEILSAFSRDMITVA